MPPCRQAGGLRGAAQGTPLRLCGVRGCRSPSLLPRLCRRTDRQSPSLQPLGPRRGKGVSAPRQAWLPRCRRESLSEYLLLWLSLLFPITSPQRYKSCDLNRSLYS